MADIFDRVEDRLKPSKSLFLDEGIFAADVSPLGIDEILYREPEKEALAEFVIKAIERTRQELFVFGLTGVGKSYSVEGMLKYGEEKYKDKFNPVWVNCRALHPVSAYQISREIASQLGRVWKAGHSAEDILRYIVGKHRVRPMILVYDEVDALARVDDSLIYKFLEAGVSQIMISNKFNWPDLCDDRVKSRAKSRRLDFKPYTEDEVYGIIQFIAQKGLKEGVIDDEGLRFVANHTVVALNSDLRKGKALLSNAVDEAMKEETTKVEIHHLESALERVKPTEFRQMMQNLSQQELMALAAYAAQRIELTEREPPTTERLYEYFKKVCERAGVKAVSQTMMKNYLERVEGAGFLDHVTKPYEATRGRTNFYYSDYSPKELGLALLDAGVKLGLTKTLEETFAGLTQKERLERR